MSLPSERFPNKSLDKAVEAWGTIGRLPCKTVPIRRGQLSINAS